MLKLIKIMDRYFEEFLCSLMLGYIAISLNIEVFNRYFLNSPSAYTDEIARTLMIMLIFLGVPWAVKSNKHVIIDLIPTSKAWQSKRVVIELISHIIFIVFSILFALAAYRAAEFHHMLGSTTEGLGIPYWLLLGSLPGIFVLTIVRLLQRIYTLLKTRNATDSQEPINV
ncbi:TRAP transporter small permease [Marinomonas ushuaiensis]|nr:TRAP transporter small permease [Marinomonas ushuaiensis]